MEGRDSLLKLVNPSRSSLYFINWSIVPNRTLICVSLQGPPLSDQ